MIPQRQRSRFSALPVHRRRRRAVRSLSIPAASGSRARWILTQPVTIRSTPFGAAHLTVAAGGTSFNVGNVAASGASAVIASRIVGSDGISVFGPGGLLLTGANILRRRHLHLRLRVAAARRCDPHTASIVGAIANEGLFSIFNANTAGITSITNNGGEVGFSNATSAGTAHISNNGNHFFLRYQHCRQRAHQTNYRASTAFGAPGGTDVEHGRECDDRPTTTAEPYSLR